MHEDGQGNAQQSARSAVAEDEAVFRHDLPGTLPGGRFRVLSRWIAEGGGTGRYFQRYRSGQPKVHILSRLTAICHKRKQTRRLLGQSRKISYFALGVDRVCLV